MPLTNAQYDTLMRTYDQKRMHSRQIARERQEEVYRAIPALEDLDEQMRSCSVASARQLLSGDSSAGNDLKKELADIRRRRLDLLRRPDTRGLSGAPLRMPGLRRHRLYRRETLSLLLSRPPSILFTPSPTWQIFWNGKIFSNFFLLLLLRQRFETRPLGRLPEAARYAYDTPGILLNTLTLEA